MTPVKFPEATHGFKAPEGLEESQVFTIPAFAGTINGGDLDGSPVIVTCWQPTGEELMELMRGKPIFLSFIGGLPPHFATLDFVGATNPGIPLTSANCPHCKENLTFRAPGVDREEVTCRNCAKPFTLVRK